MKRKLLIAVLAAVLCLLAAVPALAADTFAFTEKSIRMFEDEEITLEMRQEGKYADGEITFSSDNARAVTVSDDGTIIYQARQLCDEHLPEGFQAMSRKWFADMGRHFLFTRPECEIILSRFFQTYFVRHAVELFIL